MIYAKMIGIIIIMLVLALAAAYLYAFILIPFVERIVKGKKFKK